jgi:hypothetical protein
VIVIGIAGLLVILFVAQVVWFIASKSHS